CLTAAACAGALAVVAPLAGVGTPHAHAAGPRVSAAGTSVYTANSKKTFSKWTLPSGTNHGGFKIAGNTLTYDGSGDAGAFAPFKTRGIKNFAVEARIATGLASQADIASYDIFIRRNINTAASGIFAGYDASGGESSATDVADLYWH